MHIRIFKISGITFNILNFNNMYDLFYFVLLTNMAVAIEADYKICAKQGYQRFKEHVAMYIFFI